MPLHLPVFRQSPDPSGALHLSPTALSMMDLSSRELGEEAGAGAARPRAQSDRRRVSVDFILSTSATSELGEVKRRLRVLITIEDYLNLFIPLPSTFRYYLRSILFSYVSVSQFANLCLMGHGMIDQTSPLPSSGSLPNGSQHNYMSVVRLYEALFQPST
jgi:hypothetical protein